MSAIVAFSALLRLAAFVWAVFLWRRLRDWRAGLLTAVLGAMVVPEVMAVLERESALPLGSTLARFATSVLALIAVIIVERMTHRSAVAERQVRRELAYLEQLFLSSPEAIVLLDTGDRVIRANPGFTRLFGYTLEEVLGRRINDLIVPDDLKDEGLALTDAVAKGHPVAVEAVRRRKDGVLVDVSILGTPITIDGGQVAVYGIYRDISDRKRAESALRASEERSRTILDHIEDGYYEVDRAGYLVAFNQSFSRILGYDAGDLLGVQYRAFVDATNAARLALVFDTVSRGARGAQSIGWEVRRPDGGRRHVEGSVSPIFAPDGRSVVGFRGIVRDVTERKDAEAVVQRQWAAIESAMDGMAIFDADGRFMYVNDAHVKIYGYASPAELLGKSWRIMYSGGELARIDREIMPQFLQARAWRGEAVGTRRDGSTFPQEISLSALPGGGLACVTRDITQRRRAEAALKESEERYALAARGANDGLWDWDLRTGEVYYSPRWAEQLGLDEGAVQPVPDEWFGRVHPDDRDRLKSDLEMHLRGDSPHFQAEYRMRHEDGDYRWMLSRGIAVRDEGGTAYRIAGSQTDVTSRKQVEQQLQHDAFHDALTGLPNRALFMDRLGHALRRGRRRGDHRFGVLFLDLDRFKVINDSLGHQVGDQLLKQVALRLKAVVRPSDTVARLGGDEFVVLVEDLEGPHDATGVAERVHQELEAPLNLLGHEVVTTVSIGIALASDAYEQPDDLLRDADLAMFRAKAKGKSRHEVFDATMHRHAIERLELESDLRRAAERGEFVLDYQPIVSLEEGSLIGLEALLRWNHPTRGRVMPDDFIPLAEETRIILPIGLWVLEEASRQMKRWSDQFGLAPGQIVVHVNLSGRQFAQADLVARIAEILSRTGLAAQSLGLEITESVVMDDAEAAAAMLTDLRALNVHLQIDDFGTGYSSLSYLHRFPVDTLKIDRSFVVKMGANGEDSEIVRSIITLAQDLGMQAIAEGVETVHQLRWLRRLGCRAGQGNFLAGPVAGGEADVLLTNEWKARVG